MWVCFWDCFIEEWVNIVIMVEGEGNGFLVIMVLVKRKKLLRLIIVWNFLNL